MNPDRLAELQEERRFLLRSINDLDREHQMAMSTITTTRFCATATPHVRQLCFERSKRVRRRSRRASLVDPR